MNNSLRIALACGVGGSLGVYISSFVKGGWVFAAILTGGVFASMLVTLPSLINGVNAIGLAFQRLRSVELAYWRAYGAVLCASYLMITAIMSALALIITAIVFAADLMAGDARHSWQWLLYVNIRFDELVATAALFVAPIVMVLAVGVDKRSKEDIDKIARDMTVIALCFNPCIVGLFWIPLLGVVSFGFWLPKVIAICGHWSVKAVAFASRRMAPFVRAAFLLVHRDLRLLCFSDGCLGGTIGWLLSRSHDHSPSLRLVVGGIGGMTIGLVNYWLISQRRPELKAQ